MGRRALHSAHPLVRHLLLSFTNVLHHYRSEQQRCPQERRNNRRHYGTLGTARFSSLGSSPLNATACENQYSLGGDQSDYVGEDRDADERDAEHHQGRVSPDRREKEHPDHKDAQPARTDSQPSANWIGASR
jgi:hypothetical protein